MVEDLKKKKIVEESEGAQVIKVGKKKNPPLMVQKSDGGFGYDATDLAAMKYRVNELKSQRIVYVTDVSQELHFKNVFEASEKCGFVNQKVTKLDHMMFGMVLQEEEEEIDGKIVKKQVKIKTRAGKSVKLQELLDEAADRQFKMFQERLKQSEEQQAENAEAEQQVKVQIQGQQELKQAAEILGLSSIKYFDLK